MKDLLNCHNTCSLFLLLDTLIPSKGFKPRTEPKTMLF